MTLRKYTIMNSLGPVKLIEETLSDGSFAYGLIIGNEPYDYSDYAKATDAFLEIIKIMRKSMQFSKKEVKS